MAATLAYDDFNRSDSTNIGSNWSEISGGFQIVSNKLQLVNHNAADDVAAWVTSLGANPSADYDIETSMQCYHYGSGGGLGPAGRITDVNNMYFIQLDPSFDQFRLYKKVSGSYTQLGSTYSATLSDGVAYVAKLTMVGTSLKAYLDGVERVTATDSAITATGYPGFRGYGIDNGQIYDYFIVYGVPLATFNKNNVNRYAIKRASYY